MRFVRPFWRRLRPAVLWLVVGLLTHVLLLGEPHFGRFTTWCAVLFWPAVIIWKLLLAGLVVLVIFAALAFFCTR